ncbi:hypothetical protein JTE90_004909 [Oedothorax gibbosus]|uniref:Plexin domain-containing protein 2 n=1 Tax=Oedothorax gibbosus TaxID=931172 RepID=A0AAV6UGG3_9ARAC|nr:hypothetical protein JTE90_004909 [Oedothorax gibbosus]
MAACNGSVGFISIIFCVIAAFSAVLALDNVGPFHFNPSIDFLNLQDFDGSYLKNDYLTKTLYHVQKRSVNSPPIKKVTPSTEKKVLTKSVSSTESSLELKTVPLDQKSKIEDVSALNATVPSTTAESTNSANDKYNISVTSSDSVVNITVSSTAVPSSTTVSSTTTKPTSFPEVLPTRPSNISENATVDHHVYYNSTMYMVDEAAMAYWVNFDELPQDKVVVHRMLSDSHRKAATVSLSFDFPFYGHPLRNITIATGGFIYMGDYMHSWLAATQYVAPLMANFDTSLSNESTVRYFDNGTAFVIEWHAVTLQDAKIGGNFSFQATLMSSGNIVFVYEIIPVSIKDIGDDVHPVKVGLSDAYVIDRLIYFIRRKTIYEYHRIDMKKEEIGNHTAIYFTAIKTCMSFHDCNSCMSSDLGSDCVWCESAKRCSDGLDRLRQDWLQSKCDVEKQSVNCSALPVPDVNPYVQPLTDSPYKTYTLSPKTPKSDYPYYSTPMSNTPRKPEDASDDNASTSARVAEESSSLGVGSVVAVLLILSIVLGSLMWVGYAYKNPHTSSGQLLIRYRPTQWRFRSGEARYTAASVHM